MICCHCKYGQQYLCETSLRILRSSMSKTHQWRGKHITNIFPRSVCVAGVTRSGVTKPKVVTMQKNLFDPPLEKAAHGNV